MQRGTLNILGNDVEYVNETGDTIDIADIEDSIISGKREGILTMNRFNIGIGTWKIVNPEADKWKEIAGKLYRASVNSARLIVVEEHPLKRAVTEYEQLIQEEDGEDN